MPKGTMHYHRDMLAICDAFGKYVLRAEGSDRFIGSPPIAFTFGLGGLVLFPLRVGAAAILLEKASPEDLLPAIETFGATICFTAPTAYRSMLGKNHHHNLASLRKCVSAGETLPAATFVAWHGATGIRIIDGLGSTEMLHVFVGSPEEEMRPGATGKPVPGYEARIVDAAGHEFLPARPGVSPCVVRPAAAILATNVRRNMCSTAGTSPATLISRMQTATSTIRRAPTI